MFQSVACSYIFSIDGYSSLLLTRFNTDRGARITQNSMLFLYPVGVPNLTNILTSLIF